MDCNCKNCLAVYKDTVVTIKTEKSFTLPLIASVTVISLILNLYLFYVNQLSLK